MIVKAVILFLRLQKNPTQRLELRDLLRKESLPGNVKFVGMATVPEQLVMLKVIFTCPQHVPEQLIVCVLLHHLPKEGKACRLDHSSHR